MHLGIRYPCPCADCDKVFTKKTSLPTHIKTVHSTVEQAAEMREKRLQLRSLLAEKETKGICSTTKTCQNPAIQGSFCCKYHEKIIDSVARAMKDKTDQGTILSVLINTVDEFCLLLQRQEIHLEPKGESCFASISIGVWR